MNEVPGTPRLRRASPFLIFVAVLTVLISSLLLFIQSKSFASWIKVVAARYIPKDTGIDADFSEFAIQLFPPGVAVINPVVAVRKKNILGLPEGATVRAARMNLQFQYLQMFTGKIRIHRVRVEDGSVQLVLDTAARTPTRSPRGRLQLRWEDLLEIRADEFQILNTEMSIQFPREGRSFSALARQLTVGQAERNGRLGYQLQMDVADLTTDFLKGLRLPAKIDQAQAEAWVGSSGAELSQFSLSLGGATFRAKGSLRGNVLLPANGTPDAQLLTDVKAEVLGEIPEILRAIGITTKQAPVTGTVSSTLQIKGDLVRPLETLKIQGQVDFARLGLRAWTVDHASLLAGWTADPQGGTVSLEKLILDSAERERELPHLGASGGHVEIGPVAIRPGELREQGFTVPLSFGRAHLHWFAAPGLKDVYPLTFRVSGKVLAEVKLPTRRTPKAFSVVAHLEDVDALEFQLDNQKLGDRRALTRILSIPKIHLNGAVRVDSIGVHLQDVVATLPHSRFVAQGVIDFKRGFDFRAGGPGVLSDVGTIAEIPISGDGTIMAHIHGPSERLLIDFDTDLHHARYVNLNLGNVKGRMTWDDDPSRFLIRRAAVTQGDSRLTVDGAIDLGKQEKIELSVEAPKATARDLITVFDPMVTEIPWFPRTLEGNLVGSARVSGGLGKNQLSVVARVEGANWAFHGETARALRAEAGMDRGVLFARDVVIDKRDGRILGNIRYNTVDDKISWQLSSEQLQLTDLDVVSALDVPFRGQIQLRSQGEGTLDHLKSQSAVSLSQLAVRGVEFADSHLNFGIQDRRVEMNASLFGSQAKVDYAYELKAGGASHFVGVLNHFDFTPVLLLINPEVMRDNALRGVFSGRWDLRFPAGQLDHVTGEVQVSEHHVAIRDWALDLAQPLNLTIKDGSFIASDLSWNSGVPGKSPSLLSVHARAQQGALQGSVRGKIDLGIVPLLTSTVSVAQGNSEIDLAVGGKLSLPELFGKLQINEGRVQLKSLENPFEGLRAAATFKSGALQLTRLDADVGGGKLTGGGTIDLFTDRLPEMALRLSIQRAKIKIYPFQYAQTTGTLRVDGKDAPYMVHGELTVDSAISREKMFGSGAGATGSKALPYAPPPKGSNRRTTAWLALDFRVASDGGLLVQNDLFDAEAKCDLRVLGTIEAPRLLGNVEVVQGKMNFKERAFQIRTGSVNFNSQASIDPVFAFTAATDINGTKVQLAANGKVDSFKIELTSNPALAENEILNLLTLGFTSAEARKLNVADRSNIEKSEAFSLVLHSLDFNRELKNKSGFQLQIDESVNPQQGTSAFRPSSQIDTSVSPKLVIKRQVEIFKKPVTISAGSTVGVGTNTEREVNAETHITPSISILGVINSREIPILQNSQVSAGGDLKFQWRLR